VGVVSCISLSRRKGHFRSSCACYMSLYSCVLLRSAGSNPSSGCYENGWCLGILGGAMPPATPTNRPSAKN
jgi:hypothetical protein